MASCYHFWFVIKKYRSFLFSNFIFKDFTSDPSKFCVYFIDIGHRECIPINNIRILPEEFQLKPAFAIPCCLNNICPLNGNEQSTWRSNDPVHAEFNRLMINSVTCQVHGKQNQLYYDVQIEIPSKSSLVLNKYMMTLM